MHYTSTLLAAVAGLSACVDAHMIMAQPVPFNKDTINSSPLAPDGSDYPCKANGQYTVSSMNTMPIGSTQQLSFKGSAVHGGGSCQLSITYDENPTKDSKFKVIHSIIGGCPAKGVAGNLPEDPNGSGAGTYQFTIPAGLKEGKAVLAWTWFNKIGNREMYMNCAPITITGGTKKPRNVSPLRKRDGLDDLPDMFKANLGNGCTTVDSQDVLFPDPGKSVEKFGSGAPVAPTGSCATGGSSGGSSGGSDAGQPTPSDGSAGAPVPEPSPSQPATGGVFIPSTPESPESPPAPETSEEPATPVPETPPATPSAPVAEPVTPPASGGSSGGQSGACTTEGTFNCLPDGKSFQQCASGAWAPVQQMAAGTICTPGVGPLAMSAGKIRRRHQRRSIELST